MATRKVINISRHNVVSIKMLYAFSYICTLYSKILKGRTEPYFILF